jgi:hypothetical protein
MLQQLLMKYRPVMGDFIAGHVCGRQAHHFIEIMPVNMDRASRQLIYADRLVVSTQIIAQQSP